MRTHTHTQCTCMHTHTHRHTHTHTHAHTHTHTLAGTHTHTHIHIDMIYTCFALVTATWWWGCCFWNKALTMNRQDHSWWQYSQPRWRGCSIFLGTRYKPLTLLTDNVTAEDSTHIHGHGDVLFLDVVVVLVYIQHDDGVGQCERCICVVEWLSIAFLKKKKKKDDKNAESSINQLWHSTYREILGWSWPSTITLPTQSDLPELYIR